MGVGVQPQTEPQASPHHRSRARRHCCWHVSSGLPRNSGGSTNSTEQVDRTDRFAYSVDNTIHYCFINASWIHHCATANRSTPSCGVSLTPVWRRAWQRKCALACNCPTRCPGRLAIASSGCWLWLPLRSSCTHNLHTHSHQSPRRKIGGRRQRAHSVSLNETRSVKSETRERRRHHPPWALPTHPLAPIPRRSFK